MTQVVGARSSVVAEAHRPFDTVVVVAAMLATAALALRNLEGRSFWMDEGFSAYLVAGSSERFVDRVLYEPQFVLYHLLLRIWALFGSSEIALRSLSIVFAVLTVPVVHATARRLFGRRAAVVSVAVLAVNGLFIGHAQEARPYALAAFTSSAASLCLLRALAEPDRTRPWIVWLVAAAAAMLSHPFGGFVVLAHVVVLLARGRSIPWRRIAPIVAVPAVAAGATTWGLAFIGSARIDWIPRTGLRRLVLVLEELAGGREALPLFAYVAAAGGIGVAVLRSSEGERRRLVAGAEVTLALVLVPLAVAALVSTTQPVFLSRYLIVVVPPLAVLVGAGLGNAHRSEVAVATAALVLVSLNGALHPIRDELLQDWRSVATIILTHRSEGDVVVVTPVGLATMEFYLDRAAGAAPGPVAVLGERLTSGEAPELAPCRVRTVWTVIVDYGEPEPVEAVLASTHELSARWEVVGLVIERLERRADAGPLVPLDEPCPLNRGLGS